MKIVRRSHEHRRFMVFFVLGLLLGTLLPWFTPWFRPPRRHRRTPANSSNEIYGIFASVLLGPKVGRSYYLAPFFNFPRNERFELVGGVCDCCCTQIGQSRFDLGVRKSCIRFF